MTSIEDGSMSSRRMFSVTPSGLVPASNKNHHRIDRFQVDLERGLYVMPHSRGERAWAFVDAHGPIVGEPVHSGI
jgi:hypothetical protein